MLIIAELGHFAPLLPMIACVILTLRGRQPSPDAWLLVCALFVSFLTDQFGAYLAHRGTHNLWLSYVYAPIQFGLLISVLSPSRAWRVVLLGVIVVAAAISPLLRGFARTEFLTEVIGGILVGLLLLRQSPAAGIYAGALMVYCVATIPALVTMGSYAPSISGPYFVGWMLYQALRVAALLLMMIAVVYRPNLQLEVIRGPRAGEATAGGRIAFGPAGGGDHHAVAAARQAGLI